MKGLLKKHLKILIVQILFEDLERRDIQNRVIGKK
jgi:hypothetical protein